MKNEREYRKHSGRLAPCLKINKYHLPLVLLLQIHDADSCLNWRFPNSFSNTISANFISSDSKMDCSHWEWTSLCLQVCPHGWMMPSCTSTTSIGPQSLHHSLTTPAVRSHFLKSLATSKSSWLLIGCLLLKTSFSEVWKKKKTVLLKYSNLRVHNTKSFHNSAQVSTFWWPGWQPGPDHADNHLVFHMFYLFP